MGQNIRYVDRWQRPCWGDGVLGGTTVGWGVGTDFSFVPVGFGVDELEVWTSGEGRWRLLTSFTFTQGVEGSRQNEIQRSRRKSVCRHPLRCQRRSPWSFVLSSKVLCRPLSFLPGPYRYGVIQHKGGRGKEDRWLFYLYLRVKWSSTKSVQLRTFHS